LSGGDEGQEILAEIDSIELTGGAPRNNSVKNFEPQAPVGISKEDDYSLYSLLISRQSGIGTLAACNISIGYPRKDKYRFLLSPRGRASPSRPRHFLGLPLLPPRLK
jgi:hypothetical protein